MRTGILAVLCGLLLSSALCGLPARAEAEEINFGIINTEASQHLKPLWEPFLRDMEQATGLKVNAFFASDYAGIVTGMQYGKVQVAWYGNKAAMEAVDRANAEVFAQTMDDQGIGGYYSHLIAHVSSPLTSEQDVLARAAELTFGNGDPNSTSGFLVPGYYVFALNKADPKRIFKRVLNASHETNALSVANKQVDVATCNSEALARLEITQPEKRRAIKVIWTSPLIPGDPLVWRKDLSEDVKTRIRDFIFGYGQKGPEQQRQLEVLAGLQWAPFRASDDSQLLPIRQLELFKTRTQVEASATLSAEEKAARIREIDERLAELNARMAALPNAGS